MSWESEGGDIEVKIGNNGMIEIALNSSAGIYQRANLTVEKAEELAASLMKLVSVAKENP